MAVGAGRLRPVSGRVGVLDQACRVTDLLARAATTIAIIASTSDAIATEGRGRAVRAAGSVTDSALGAAQHLLYVSAGQHAGKQRVVRDYLD
jgi:hypothetical protein